MCEFSSSRWLKPSMLSFFADRKREREIETAGTAAWKRAHWVK